MRGSLSPRLHNAAFAALGLDWCYVAFQVTRGRLETALRGLSALGIAGVNVTIPHKEAALAYLDDITDDARSIGAVNTIRVEGDRLIGHNTDTTGMLDALTREKMNLELLRIWQESRKSVVFITHSIPEAVFLSDRVAIMSPRPGHIQEIVPIHLPRPRTMETMETVTFTRVVAYIRRVLTVGA